jgi:hypothetical protein
VIFSQLPRKQGCRVWAPTFIILEEWIQELVVSSAPTPTRPSRGNGLAVSGSSRSMSPTSSVRYSDALRAVRTTRLFSARPSTGTTAVIHSTSC